MFSRSVICALALAIATGCGSGFQPLHHIVPAPAGALAAAPLGSDMIAILAGDERTKAVSLVSLSSGALVRVFGVTKETSDLSSAGPDGPLLLTIAGTTADGRPMGAVEIWSLEGVKQRVVPMPMRALNVTRSVAGTAYVLIAADSVRAAVPLDVSTMQSGRAIPLDANSRKLEQCRIGETKYLVYTQGAGGTVAVRDLNTGVTLRSTVVADDPTCVTGTPGVYAIEKTLVSDRIALLDIPGFHRQKMLPAQNDATALYESFDHHLLALDATRRVATVEKFPELPADVK